MPRGYCRACATTLAYMAFAGTAAHCLHTIASRCCGAVHTSFGRAHLDDSVLPDQHAVHTYRQVHVHIHTCIKHA
jgi:hypothetical protein